MAIASDVEANENLVAVSVIERGSEISMQFTPELDSESVGAIEESLAKNARTEIKGHFPKPRYSVLHAGSKKDNSSLTRVTTTYNHFGRDRHELAQRFVESASSVLLGEAGVKLEITSCPSDFGLNLINNSLRDLSAS